MAVILLLASTGHLGCGRRDGNAGVNSGEAPAVAELAVKAVAVSSREWAVTVPVSGSLRSQSVVEIRTEVAGRLAEARFEEGDSVSPGQLLAEIDPANYRLALGQALAALEVAEAGLARAGVTLDHAKREKDRADNLLRTGGITEKDHQEAVTGVRDAESLVKLAEAQRDQAKAAVAIAEKALADCRIFAQTAGQIQKKHFDRGSLLGAGFPVYTLVDNTRLELECLVPSYRLAEIRTGQKVQFTTPTWGDRPFGGTVASINPMVESASRAVKVLVRIVNAGAVLKSGMYARGAIEIRREPAALVVPRSSFTAAADRDTSGHVYVAEGGRAVQRAVTILDSSGDLLRIGEGLREGEKVITEIGPALKDGSAVRVAGTGGGEVR